MGVPMSFPVPVPGRVSPTWDGHLASGKDHREGGSAGAQLQEAWQVAAYTLLPTVAPLLTLLVGHLRGFMLLSLWMFQCSSLQRSQLFRNSIWTFRGKERKKKKERGKREPSGKATAHKMALLLH